MTRDDSWDEVWAEYDAKHAVAPPPAEPRAPRRRGLAMTWLLLGCLGTAATAYAAAPLRAGRELVEAFRRADHAAIAAQVDWAALRHSLAAAMPEAAHGEAGSGAWLEAMAQMVAARLATPEGLLDLLRHRLGLPRDRPAAWPEPVLQPLGLRSARLSLTPDAGITLRLALREGLPPRWQVVAVEIAD